MNLDIIKVIMLEVAESVEMKVDEYRQPVGGINLS